jgi:thiol-disulfide isomerase/thioredoxin
MSRKSRRSGRKRSYTIWIIPVLVIVTGVVGYYIFTQSGVSSGCSLCNTPASPAVLSDLYGVSTSTLNTVGSGAAGIASPTSISGGAPLTLNGKPEILYMGAEFCPYCAAERWAMIVALDKFGNFTGIQYMESDPTDVYPNTPTFTFVNATYSSSYIAFVTVEETDRNQAPLQTATAQETTLLQTYDTGGSIPFVDFANAYAITSASYIPTALRTGQNPSGAPYNWTQIAPQLNTASSVFAQNIDGTANRIISAICKVDGGSPASICTQSFADLALSYTRTSPSGGSQLQVSDAVQIGPAPSVAAARFAPTRLTYWV